MKRMVIVFLGFCSAVMCAHAWIPDDFYLNNAPLQSPTGAEMKLLPSTLRAVLFEGEAEEIYIDVIPENLLDTAVSWSLLENNGVVQIYPRGRSCAILAVSEGEEKLAVSCAGETVNIPVLVEKKPEVRVRTFEREGEPYMQSKAPLKTYRTVMRGLITLGAVLCFCSVFYIIYDKVVKRK